MKRTALRRINAQGRLQVGSLMEESLLKKATKKRCMGSLPCIELI